MKLVFDENTNSVNICHTFLKKTVSMINKKYCKIQANIIDKIKKQYLGKYALEFGKIIKVFTDKH